MIPTYNRKKIVVKAIESALSQTYKNIEVIVSDNFSSDGTFEYLHSKYFENKKIKIYKNSKNIGPVLNWINCIDKCKGNYVKLLFSDDQISNNYVDETIRYLKDNTNIGFVFTPAIIKIKSKKKFFYKTYNKPIKIFSKNLVI